MTKDIVQKELDEIKSFVESIDETNDVDWCNQVEWMDEENVKNIGVNIDRSVCYITSQPDVVERKLRDRFDLEEAANVQIVDETLNGDSAGFVAIKETRTEQGKEPLV